MKITVTYEKKDILRLVQQDMCAQGIKVKPGTPLKYKGALQVTFAVDTEDDAPELPSAEAPPSVEPMETSKGDTPAKEAAAMGSVLGASRQLVMTQPGKFEQRPERPLEVSDRMQESNDYPQED